MEMEAEGVTVVVADNENEDEGVPKLLGVDETTILMPQANGVLIVNV